MDNELIDQSRWVERNWKWFLPTFLLLFVLFIGLVFCASIDGNVTEMAQAYSDNALYEKAIEKAKTNKRVLEVIGQIEPIDKLAILEGNAIYSNNNNSVEMSVRIKGSIGNGKMDIHADKKGNEWDYKKINIRIKEPKEEIQVLKDTIEKNM